MGTSYGYGDYVQVEDDSLSINYNDAKTVVQTRFSDTTNLVNDYRILFENYLAAFNDILTDPNFQLPDGWEDIFNITVPEIHPVVPSTLPTMGDIELDDNYEECNIPDPSLQAIPYVDWSEIQPPDDVIENIGDLQWEEDTYLSAIADALLTKITDGFERGSGIPADVEDAIIARGLSRQTSANEKLYREAIGDVSSRSGGLATGALTSVILEVHDLVAGQQTDLNNDIIKIQYENEHEFAKFITGVAVEWEKVLRDFHNAKNDRSLAYAKEVVNTAILLYAERIKQYIAKVEQNKAYIELKTAEITSVAARNQAEIDAFIGRLEGCKLKNEIIISKNKNIVDAYIATVEAYKADRGAEASWWSAQIESQKANLERADIQLRVAIAVIEAELANLTSFNTLKETILNDMTSHVAQVIASSLNATNTGATLSYSGSESKSESVGFSAGISSDHNFDETET